MGHQPTGTQIQIWTKPSRWDEIHSNTPDAADLRKRLDYWFSKYFPQGHDESLHKIVPTLQELYRGDPATRNMFPSWRLKSFMSNLDFMHPDALDFIRRFGIDYTPRLWRRPPHIEPKPRVCFFNATIWMYAHNLNRQKPKYIEEKWPEMTYVEGLVYGPTVRAPMLHAWNGFNPCDGDAVDFTFYQDCGWKRYLGIAFSQTEWVEICKVMDSTATAEDPKPQLLFRKENFTPEVRKKTEEILSRRKI